MSEQSPQYQRTIIEQVLTDENDYFHAGMTEEQIKHAAQIILDREIENHDVRHALEQRRYRTKHQEGAACANPNLSYA